MSNEQETISDIVADIRAQNQGLPEDSYALSPLVCDLLSLADRIEAAAKRECEATSEKSSQVCNAAKMREALEDAEKVLDDSSHSMYGIPPCMNDLLARIRAALSAPPRNCDLYRTKKELDAAYEKYREYVIMSNSNPFVAKDEMMTKEDWLFSEARREAK